ncbi:MAG: hypothetical protein HKN46_10435 [Acidimicrobiia bacterium]|nr:hypothetical protein [Acidimicrobiia bacterium]
MSPDIGTIGRHLDLDVPSNRFAINVAVAAGIAGTIFGWIGDQTIPTAIITGAFWGIGSFLGWVTGRELHHDDPRPAGAAAILAPLGAAFLGEAGILLVVGIMVTARITLNSTGRGLSKVEGGLIALLGLFIAQSISGWAIAMVMAVGLARAASKDGAPPILRTWAFGLSVGATVVQGLSDGFAIPPIETAEPVAVAIGALMGMGIAGRTVPEVNTDSSDTPPSASDQFVARLLTLIAVVAATLLSTNPGIVFPAAAALIALSLRRA